MQSHVCAHCSPLFLFPFLLHLFLHHRTPLTLSSTSGPVQFAVPVHASLEDTRCSSYAHTRVYTPCSSQISTLREHTNKPRVYLVRPAYTPVSRRSPLSAYPIPLSNAFVLSNLTDSYHSLTLTRGVVLNPGKRGWHRQMTTLPYRVFQQGKKENERFLLGARIC